MAWLPGSKQSPTLAHARRQTGEVLADRADRNEQTKHAEQVKHRLRAERKARPIFSSVSDSMSTLTDKAKLRLASQRADIVMQLESASTLFWEASARHATCGTQCCASIRPRCNASMGASPVFGRVTCELRARCMVPRPLVSEGL